MARFIGKRLLVLVPQLAFVVVACFFLLRALPVNPVSHELGAVTTPQAYRAAARSLGLDKPLLDQFWIYIKGLPRLDLGNSWSSSKPVASEIGQRLPVTVQLVLLGFVVAVGVAVPLGLAAAARPRSLIDRVATGYALFAGAQPDFLWGLIFIFVFFATLGWAPAPLGLVDPIQQPPGGPTQFILIDTLVHGDVGQFGSALAHFVLPVLTLAFVQAGPILKITRQSALDVFASDFLLYAKAAGLQEKTRRRMVIRNAFAPVVTIVGILFGFSIGGAVLIETIFSLNGLGQYAVESTLNLDFPAIQGAVIVMTAFSLVMYLLMDIAYAALDPRVRAAT